MIRSVLGLKVDFEAGSILLNFEDRISDLALQANVCHEALASFGIDARLIAGVGVAVGIAIGDIEKINEIVTILNDRHRLFSLVGDSRIRWRRRRFLAPR